MQGKKRQGLKWKRFNAEGFWFRFLYESGFYLQYFVVPKLLDNKQLIINLLQKNGDRATPRLYAPGRGFRPAVDLSA